MHLQEHLRYVLANADIRSTLGEQQKKTQARKISEKAKDVRSSFFMKIGVLKEKESGKVDWKFKKHWWNVFRVLLFLASNFALRFKKKAEHIVTYNVR